jgi:RNA polymerase sigma factor (sigma-70 family)
LDLARRLRTGDESALEEFFAEYFPRLYRFARVRLGGDDDAAEEVAHTTLIGALAKIGMYRGEAALFTWLYTFCRREISAWFDCSGKTTRVSLADDSAETRAVWTRLRRRPEAPSSAATSRRRSYVVVFSMSIVEFASSRRWSVSLDRARAR